MSDIYTLPGQFPVGGSSQPSQTPAIGPPPAPSAPQGGAADFNNILNDPQFQAMSYQDQLRVREQWFKEYAVGDPQFQGMSKQEQDAFSKKFLLAAPAFSGPKSQTTDQLMQLAETLKSGAASSDDKSNALLALYNQSTYSNMGIARTIMKTAVNIGHALGVSKGVDIPDTGPQEKKATDYLATIASQDPELQPKVGYAIGGGSITGFVTDFLAGRTALSAVQTLFTGTALAKQAIRAEALPTRISTAASLGKSAKVVKLSDRLAALQETLGSSATSPTGAFASGMFPRKFAAATQAASKASRWLYETAIPNVVESTRDAAILTTHDFMKDHFTNQELQSLPAWGKIVKTTQLMGENFLGDMVAMGIFSVVGGMGKALSKVLTTGYARASRRVIDDSTQRAFRDYLLEGRALPAETLKDLSPEAQSALKRARAKTILATKIPDLTHEELSQVVAKKNGYDLSKEDGKWVVRVDFQENNILGKYATVDNATQAAFKHQQAAIDHGIASSEDLFSNAAASGKLRMSEIVKAQAGEVNLGGDSWVKFLTPHPQTGELSPNAVRGVTQSFMRASGMSPQTAARFKVKVVDDYFSKTPAELPANTIAIPRTIVTPSQEERFIKKFFSDLKANAGKFNVSRAGGARAAKDFLEGFPVKKQEATLSPLWVKYNLAEIAPGAKLVQDGPGWKVTGLPSGEVQFPDLTALGDWIHSAVYTPTEDSLRLALKIDHGIELRADNGRLFLKRQGQVLRSGTGYESAADVIAANPDLAPKLPVDKMPELMLIDPSGAVQIQGRVISGPASELAAFAGKYRRYSTFKMSKQVKEFEDGTKLSYSPETRFFTLESPGLNYVKSFENYKDAVKWVQSQSDQYEYLTAVAAEKGAEVQQVAGRFLIRHMDSPKGPLTANNLKELNDVIAKLPTNEFAARELSGLADAVVGSIQRQLPRELQSSPTGVQSVFSEADFSRLFDEVRKKGKQVNAGGRLYRPTDRMFQKFAQESGNNDYYNTVFNDVNRAVDAQEGLMGTWEDYISRLFAHSTKKQRKVYGMMLEQPESAWTAKAKDLYQYDLTPRDKEIAGYIRDVMGRDQSRGLFKVFGVDGWEFLSFYRPRIKEWLAENADAVDRTGMANGVLRQIFGNKPVKSIEFFGKNLRTNDLINFANLEDAKDILTYYGRKGYKAITVGPAMDKAIEWLNKNSGQISGSALDHAITYLSDVGGMNTNYATRALDEATIKVSGDFLEALKKNKVLSKLTSEDKKAWRDFIGKLQGLTVGSTMAFKVYNVVRNAQQIWTTLAWRVGFDTTMEALKRVNAHGDEIAFRMRQAGRLKSDAPIFGLAERGSLNRFNRIGMKGYLNADDLDRMVVDQAAEILIKDAGKRLEKGIINEEQFLKMSGLSRMDPQIQATVVKRLKGEGLEAAYDEYSRTLVRETMFPYREGSNPLLFRGVWGRMFGMFGHYPVYYLENLRRGFANLSTAEKLVTGVRLAATTAALTTTFGKVFGIRPTDFTLQGQMLINGGPYYQFVNELLDRMSGYNAYQRPALTPADKQKRLAANVRWAAGQITQMFVPGSNILRHAMLGLEAIDKGREYEGVLRLLSIPVDPSLGDPKAGNIENILVGRLLNLR